MTNEKKNPKIILRKIAGVIYYEVEYYDTSDNKTHIGYSSYDIAIVLRFLREYFDIPTANVSEVKHGEWKGWTTSAFMKIDDYGEPLYSDRKFYRCSQCHYGTVVKTKYCPNCGVKMDGETT